MRSMAGSEVRLAVKPARHRCFHDLDSGSVVNGWQSDAQQEINDQDRVSRPVPAWRVGLVCTRVSSPVPALARRAGERCDDSHAGITARHSEQDRHSLRRRVSQQFWRSYGEEDIKQEQGLPRMDQSLQG